MQKILGYIRRAVSDYNMIADGDKIVVGISGGKDSILLFHALSKYRLFSKESFELIPVHVDMGFSDTDKAQLQRLKDYFISEGYELVVEQTQLAELIFDVRKETNPCSLCSKMRRGALNTKAKELGANKIALGHHSDDVLETMLLSFFYEGRLSTFKPVSYMDRSQIALIRPMIYVEEMDVTGTVKRLNLPVVVNPCPMDKHSKREDMKELVRELNNRIPHCKDRMMGAITHPERNSLWDLKE